MKRNIDSKKIKPGKFKMGEELTFKAELREQTAQDDLIDYVLLFGDELRN